MSLARIAFGTLPDGRPVDLYVLSTRAGLEARVLTWGATLVALTTPDRDGRPVDVVLGFDALEPYLGSHPYVGAVIGRYANRISGARFGLDGRSVSLSANEGANQLHGGPAGFDRKLWDVVSAAPGDEPGLVLSCRSPDGDQGFPGNVEATVTYSLSGTALRVGYGARTDGPTVVNLTHHAYFNLAGRGAVLDHVLRIDADRFLPVTADRLPTGELQPVRGTPMDFTRPKAVGRSFDHCWVLNGGEPAAELRSPETGITLELLTTQPGVQLYTGDVLDGTLRGKGGVPYAKHAGLCLETQHFPDSPNRPSFPSTVLRPGEAYSQSTVFRFI